MKKIQYDINMEYKYEEIIQWDGRNLKGKSRSQIILEDDRTKTFLK